MKDPLDQTILQQLLWELKPRTVIEFGAYKGGSALWIADMLKLFGCQSRVVSIDIDLSLLDAEARKSSDAEFIQMTSKCGKNQKSDTRVAGECVIAVLPHFGVFCSVDKH